MNLIEQLDTMGLEYREHSTRENEIFLCCPFCEEEGTTPDYRFRLGVNVVSGVLHCFNCGKKSSNSEYTFKELARALETGTLQAAAQTVKREVIRTKPELPKDFTPVTYERTEDHWNDVALRYLRTRNVSLVQIKKKKIGYSTVGDYRYRIIVPVYYEKELAGFVGRAFVTGLQPKYKNSVGQKVIYNVPETPKRGIVLTEGVFDAMAIEKSVARYWDSGALLGTSLTERQMAQLEPYEKVILWPDPDILERVDVMKGWKRVGTQLQEANKKVQIVLPSLELEEYDPSELFPQEIEAKIRTRVDFSPDVFYKVKVNIAFKED